MKCFDESQLISQISKFKMDDLLKKFNTLDRLSGSLEELEGIQYILEKLNEYNVTYNVHEFDAYLSDPVKGELQVLEPEVLGIKCKTRSFSANEPDGIEGELVYVQNVGSIFDDEDGELDVFHGKNNLKSENPVKGKIIISEGGSPQHIEKAEKLGAIGLIHVWPSKEDAIHEMISSPVWGQPTMETKDLLPKIPEVSVTNSDGQKLIKLAKESNAKVRINTVVNNEIKRLKLPVADIPGKTEKYVLICGHIDSWHVGITDNAVGNALCLEVARLFAPYAGKLERGIKIAWWPGHSNGRYTGSTWFCDNFFEDISKNCVLMINNDSPGVKYGGTNLLRTTLSEPEGYFQQIVKELTGKDALWDFPMRAGDYSFWGTGIPQQMMLRNIPDKGHDNAVVGGSGGGWWWHTEYDTYDKMDLDNLVRDTAINVAIIFRWVNANVLPIDIGSLAKNICKVAKEIDVNSNDIFDFQPVYKTINKLLDKVDNLNLLRGTIDINMLNEVLQSVSGRLVTLMFSASSKYYQDPACAQGPLPGLARVKGVETDEKLDLLFMQTDFIRQRNRIIMEINESIKELDYIIDMCRLKEDRK